MAPAFNCYCQFGAQVRNFIRLHPLNGIGNDDWRRSDVQFGRQRFQVFIVEYDATVARAWRSAIGVPRRAMQPNAMAIPAAYPVPFVRIADWISSSAVEIAKFFFRQLASHVIDADGCFLVAFPKFFQTVLADGYVVIRDITRCCFGILEYEKRRLC